jgi:hypothetical protein
VPDERDKRQENLRCLRENISKCKGLAQDLKSISHEIDVQIARSQKLLKKKPKELFSQAILESGPLTRGYEQSLREIERA